MLIDVRPILHIPGKELNFQFELDLSDMEFGGRNPIGPSLWKARFGTGRKSFIWS